MATAAGVLSSFRGVTRRPADLHNDCSSAKMLLPNFQTAFPTLGRMPTSTVQIYPCQAEACLLKECGGDLVEPSELASWMRLGFRAPKPEILNPKPHILKPYSGDSISSRTPALERFRATGRKKSISTLPAFLYNILV